MDNDLEVNYLKKELYELIKSDESIFDFIQESSVDGLWYWDLENPENEWMNPKFWMVLGYNPKEMPHKSSSWQSIINQDDLKAAMERVALHLENPNHPYDQIVRYTHKNGSTVWIRCRGMAIRDKNGKPVRMLGAHHDITDQKSLENYLISSKEKTEEINANITAIIESTNDSIWSFDRNYDIIYINKSFQRDFEASFGVLLEQGSNLINGLNENLRFFWKHLYDRVLSGERFKIEEEVETTLGKLFIELSFNPIIKNDLVIGGSCFGRNISERKRVEESLSRSEERFRKVSELMTDYAYSVVISEDGTINHDWVTDAYFQYYDCSPEELNKKGGILSLIYKEDVPNFKERLSRLLEGEIQITEYRIWNKNGRLTWFRDFGKPEWDDTENRVVRIVGAIEDITSYKAVEEEQQRSQNRLSLFFNQSVYGFYCSELDEPLEWNDFTDKDEVLKTIADHQFITEINDAMLDQYGATRECFIGKPMSYFFRHDTETGREFRRKLFDEGILNVETEEQKEDGSKVFFEGYYRCTYDEKGRITGTLGVQIDVTKRKLAEESLKKSQKRLSEKEAQYRLLAENSQDLIYVYNLVPEPRYEYISPSCLQLTGYRQEEGYADPFTYHKFINTPSGVERFTQFLLDPEQPPRIEEEWKRKDGSFIWVEQVVVRNFDENGNLISFQSTVRDITERKHAEALFQDIIDKNPMSIQILDLEGFTIKTNYAHTKLFGVKPPPNYSMFKDAQLLRLGFEEIFQRIKEGEIVYFPDTYYNVHNVDPTFPDTPVWIKAVGFPLYDKNRNPEYFVLMHEDITERKRAEEKLRESEEKYRIFVETSQDAIFSVDKNGYYLFANSTFAQSLGFTPEYFDGKSFWDIYPKDLADMRYENVLKVFETGKPNEIEVVVPLPDRTLYYLAKTNPITDTNGNVIQVLVTATDISERRKAEFELIKAKERIEESEAFYRQTFEESPVGISHVNPKGQFIKVNKLFCEIIGYTENELLNLTIENITYPDDLKLEEVFINQVLNNEIDKFSIEKRYIHKNGHIIWIALHSNVVRDKNHEVLFAISTITDITERIELQSELLAAKERAEESETKFKAAFYTSPDSVNINKLDGEYIEINEGFTRLTGYTEEDVIGKLSTEIVIWEIPEDRVKLVEGLKKDGIVENLKSLFRAKDGTIIPGQMSAKIIMLNDEPHILSVTRDIREQTKYENELIKAKERAEESDRLKSAFLANMSHEIRTPMNGILGFANLLKKPGLDAQEHQEFIEVIEKSGMRMLNIINDIIDISKIEAGLMKLRLSESNICEQINYAYTFFKPEAEAKGLILSVNKPEFIDNLYITTDREKLYAILTNLVKNAIKYTEKGKIEIGCFPKGNFIEFFVKDTGIGIPKDRQEAIFERFIQADIEDKMARQGAGLGLAITKAYIEMLDGTIWVESEPGKGSEFRFTLPYKNSKEEMEDKKSIYTVDDEIEKNSKFKLLIVEDDPISEKLLDYELRTYTKELFKVRTGTEAIEIMLNNPDIQLILMDIRLPEMNGYESTRLIRQFNKDVIIIAQTAYGLTGDREKAIEAGCNDYIAKPIQKEELFRLIRKYGFVMNTPIII